MLLKRDVMNSLWFDIETTSRHESLRDYVKSEPKHGNFWIEKCAKDRKGLDPSDTYWNEAMIYPEHGQVISICAGAFVDGAIQTEMFAFDSFDSMMNEEPSKRDKKILIEFNKFISGININLAGYKIRTFDIPFVYRRMLINGILPSDVLITYDKKPWEVPCLDLYDVWGGSTLSGMSGFGVCCDLTGVESSKKEGMSGDKVKDVFWKDKNLQKINEYCEDDVRCEMGFGLRLTKEHLSTMYNQLLLE